MSPGAPAQFALLAGVSRFGPSDEAGIREPLSSLRALRLWALR
jgi:hypothetical protein